MMAVRRRVISMSGAYWRRTMQIRMKMRREKVSSIIIAVERY